MTASSPRSDEPEFVPKKTYRLYDWIDRWPWLIACVLVVLAVVLAALFPVIADDGEPSFDRRGEIYDDGEDTVTERDQTVRRNRRFLRRGTLHRPLLEGPLTVRIPSSGR